MGGLWTPGSGMSFDVDNFGASPVATLGTSVIPGASNAEGSWTNLLGALAFEVIGFLVTVTGGATAGTIKSHLLDIGIDPAGGSSYVPIISNIVCGNSRTPNPGGYNFYFPMRLPAGATVAARVQGVAATAGTVRIGIKCWGRPGSEWLIPVGQYSETIGAITNSSGVGFTPGNAAFGTWVSLGATTRELWWWQIAFQIDNTVLTAEGCYIEIAHGDATTKNVITRVQSINSAAEEISNVVQEQLCPASSYCPVVPGTDIYVRGRCQNAPDTGYNAVAVGIGG